MSLVCGTDFSEPASRAVQVASALAARSNQTLYLVHVLEFGRRADASELRSAELGWAERMLGETADRAREEGVKVEIQIEEGSPDEALLNVATRVSAKLLLIGAVGRRRGDTQQLGSHADRLSQRARVPVLVVRDAKPFTAWTQGERPLRVLLGADASQSAEHAMRWVSELQAYGPCAVTAVQLYWAPAQFKRLGLHGMRDYLEPDAEVARALEQGLAARLRGCGIEAPVLRSLPHMGGVGDRLAALARDDQADLIVVGSHVRGALARLVEGSVSRDVLQHAGVGVACVPAPAEPEAAHVPELRSVLVASDFSAGAAQAVALAHAIAAAGAAVHFVHVVPERRANPSAPHDVFGAPDAHPELRARLAQLALPHAGRNCSQRLHVLESDDPGAAICQAAERLDAAVICLGTRGHGRAGGALGSVAHAVLRATRRPVLIAHEPEA